MPPPRLSLTTNTHDPPVSPSPSTSPETSCSSVISPTRPSPLAPAHTPKTVDTTPWVHIPYRESMLKYGSDKPDLRIPIEMFDCSELFKNSGFNAFAGAVKAGAVVRAIPVKGIKDKPRSFFDKLLEHAKTLGSKGLAYLIWDGDIVK